MLSSADRERITIEGIVKHDAKLSRRGIVAYLSPWWRDAAIFVDALIRVRIPRSLQDDLPQLPKGTAVRLTCSTLEAPRAGAGWWTATACEQPSAPDSVTEPLIVHDRFFGRLSIPPRSMLITCKRSLHGAAYRVSIRRSASAENRDALRDDLERARRVIRLLELSLASIHDEVSTRALAIYCARWRGARRRLTRDQVASRVALSSVQVEVNGDLVLSYGDGDLFFGHWLEVPLGSDLRVHRIEVGGLQNVS